MEQPTPIERLEKRGIKPTANRILVLKAMLDAPRALSLADLETRLGTVDKSSIFRTLAHFQQHHLIHVIEDGSGSVKYELCGSDTHCSVADMHAHFYCEACHETFCLHSAQVPVIELPDGFAMHAINYMVKGLCDRCAAERES